MKFKPVAPEDASTVILVREGDHGLEVYMTKRQDYLRFLGGYYVFPGGKVDPDDADDQVIQRCASFGPDDALASLDGIGRRRSMGFRVAGLRELFEEVGILLADDAQGRFLERPEPHLWERLAHKRHQLQYDELRFNEVLASEEVSLTPSRLLWFAHWITPATSPRRFSTFFFIARAPEGQRTEPFEDEIANAAWIRPADALAKWRQGKWPMIPPTLSSLDTISAYESWKGLEADYSRPPSEHPRTVCIA